MRGAGTDQVAAYAGWISALSSVSTISSVSRLYPISFVVRFSPISSVMRVATNGRVRPKACTEHDTDLVGVSTPWRPSACLANSANAVTSQRGYPIAGVTPGSPSPFT